jgi:hypothetical protein
VRYPRNSGVSRSAFAKASADRRDSGYRRDKRPSRAASQPLRRAQLAAAGAAQSSQLALFATLHDDRRPPCERTASGRYLQPSLFAALSGGDRQNFGNTRGSAETTGVVDFGEQPR